MDLLYKVSGDYLLGGMGLDITSTKLLMDHPTVAHREDGSVLTRYYGVEAGWARIFGQRNTFAAVSANAALDTGVYLLSRKMHRHGGLWWNLAAVGLNVSQGTIGMTAGIHNVCYNADVDRKVQQATGYWGRIMWSH